MKILVTGGSGFLGNGAVREAIGHGHDVVIVDMKEPLHLKNIYPLYFSNTQISNFQNEHWFSFSVPRKDESCQEISFYKADIRNKKSLEPAFYGVNAVIHTAAIFNHHMKYDEYAPVNVFGARNVRELAQDNGVRQIVNYGAGLTYGSGYNRLITEKDALHIEDDYSRSKAEGEVEVFEGHGKNLETILFRIFGAYGKEQVYGLPAFLKTVYNGFVTVPRKKVLASYVHERDVSRAALHAVENHCGKVETHDPSDVAYNLADKNPVSLSDVAEALHAVKEKMVVMKIPSLVVLMSGAAASIVRSEKFNYRIARLGLHSYAADCSKLVSTGFKHEHPDVLDSMLGVYQHYAKKWDAEKKK